MLGKIQSVREIAEREEIPDFWQGKIPCWEMCHCPQMIKSECPAPKYSFLPCWEIEGTYCKLTANGNSGRDISICRRCRVYRRWGQNKAIELKLSGKGIDSFRRFLEEKTEEVLLKESAPFPYESGSSESKTQAFSTILRRRREMYITELDKIIDKDSAEGKGLTMILKDVQDECKWLPREILEHVSQRLEVSSTKVYRTAIFGKGLNVIPRNGHRIDGNICVVDLLKYYLDFLQHDLCGKCLPCREGMRQMYNIVADIARGEGDEASIDLLREVAEWVAELSACNQGVIVANIVLTALSDCRDRFEAHVNGNKCPAGVCTSV